MDGSSMIVRSSGRVHQVHLAWSTESIPRSPFGLTSGSTFSSTSGPAAGSRSQFKSFERHFRSLGVAVASIVTVGVLVWYTHIMYIMRSYHQVASFYADRHSTTHISVSLCINLRELIGQMKQNTHSTNCCSTCSLIECLFTIQRNYEMNQVFSTSNNSYSNLIELINRLYDQFEVTFRGQKSSAIETDLFIENKIDYFYMNLMCRLFKPSFTEMPISLRLFVTHINGTMVHKYTADPMPFLVYLHQGIALTPYANSYVVNGPRGDNLHQIIFMRFFVNVLLPSTKLKKSTEISLSKGSMDANQKTLCVNRCFWLAQSPQVQSRLLLNDDLINYVLSAGSTKLFFKNPHILRCTDCPFQRNNQIVMFSIVEHGPFLKAFFHSSTTIQTRFWFRECPIFQFTRIDKNPNWADRLQNILTWLTVSFAFNPKRSIRNAMNRCWASVVHRSIPIRCRYIGVSLLTVVLLMMGLKHYLALIAFWRSNHVLFLKKPIALNQKIAFNFCFQNTSVPSINSDDAYSPEQLYNFYINKIKFYYNRTVEYEPKISQITLYTAFQSPCIHFSMRLNKNWTRNVLRKAGLLITLKHAAKFVYTSNPNELIPIRARSLQFYQNSLIRIVRFRHIDDCDHHRWYELNHQIHNFTLLQHRLQAANRSITFDDCQSYDVCRHACTAMEQFEQEHNHQRLKRSAFQVLEQYSERYPAYSELPSTKCDAFLNSILKPCYEVKVFLFPIEETRNRLTLRFYVDPFEMQIHYTRRVSMAHQSIYLITLISFWLSVSPSSVARHLLKLFQRRLQVPFVRRMLRNILLLSVAIGFVVSVQKISHDYLYTNPYVSNLYIKPPCVIELSPFRFCFPRWIQTAPFAHQALRSAQQNQWSSFIDTVYRRLFKSIHFTSDDLKENFFSPTHLMQPNQFDNLIDSGLLRYTKKRLWNNRTLPQLLISPQIKSDNMCFRIYYRPLMPKLRDNQLKQVSYVLRFDLTGSQFEVQSLKSTWFIYKEDRKAAGKAIVIRFRHHKIVQYGSFLLRHNFLSNLYDHYYHDIRGDSGGRMDPILDEPLPRCTRLDSKNENCLVYDSLNFRSSYFHYRSSMFKVNFTSVEFHPEAVNMVLLLHYKIGLDEFLIQLTSALCVWLNLSLTGAYFALERRLRGRPLI
jgi:hypothetical protein